MKKLMIGIQLLHCLCWCYGGEEKCVSDFAGLENAVISNPANQHQISLAYFPLKHETYPACVISYYYIGIIRSDENKQNCSTVNVSVEDEVATGCLKYKWCINSFYMELDLSQLQDFSFYILLNDTTEVELEIPPICNVTDINVIYEHFLRITTSVSHWYLSIILFITLCLV